MAYCLGLIPAGLRQNLETVGNIRNSFAHDYFSLTLDADGMAELVNSLIPPTIHQTLTVDGDHSTVTGPQPMPLVGSIRDRFNAIVVMMVNSLLLTGLQTKRRERN